MDKQVEVEVVETAVEILKVERDVEKDGLVGNNVDIRILHHLTQTTTGRPVACLLEAKSL